MASEYATQLFAAREEGRFADALEMILTAFRDEGDSSRFFITTFVWEQLAKEYAPALDAMRAERNAQVRRLFAGEYEFGSPDQRWRKPRLAVISGMNDVLGDEERSYQVFADLHRSAPEAARRSAYIAMSAVVRAGDYALAAQYLHDPLKRLSEVNDVARSFPLFPAGAGAPRLAAELSNFMSDVRLQAAVLDGTNRHGEAAALREAALAGLESSDLRELASRELLEPGVIVRELVARQMADEEFGHE